jgi:hypothetical protein
MFKILDLKYYKTEVNDESRETKCNQIVICKNLNPSKKHHCLNNLNNFFVYVLKLKGITKFDMIMIIIFLHKKLYIIIQSKIIYIYEFSN